MWGLGFRTLWVSISVGMYDHLHCPMIYCYYYQNNCSPCLQAYNLCIFIGCHHANFGGCSSCGFSFGGYNSLMVGQTDR